MDTYVHARPQSQQLAHARAVLATLADRPGMDGLAASEAFCVLAWGFHGGRVEARV